LSPYSRPNEFCAAHNVCISTLQGCSQDFISIEAKEQCRRQVATGGGRMIWLGTWARERKPIMGVWGQNFLQGACPNMWSVLSLIIF